MPHSTEPWCVGPVPADWWDVARHTVRNTSHIAVYATDDFVGVLYGRDTSATADRHNAARVVACVNALAGVPDAVLAGPRTLTQELALAALRGGPPAVVDRLLEEREAADRAAEAGVRPVTRAELVRLLREKALLLHITPHNYDADLADVLARLHHTDPETPA